jgi:hypothetical protein
MEIKNITEVEDIFLTITADTKIKVISPLTTKEFGWGQGLDRDGEIFKLELEVDGELLSISIMNYHLEKRSEYHQLAEISLISQTIQTPEKELNTEEYFEYAEGIKDLEAKKTQITDLRKKAILLENARIKDEEEAKLVAERREKIIEFVQKVIDFPKDLYSRYTEYNEAKLRKEQEEKEAQYKTEVLKGRDTFNKKFQ